MNPPAVGEGDVTVAASVGDVVVAVGAGDVGVEADAKDAATVVDVADVAAGDAPHPASRRATIMSRAETVLRTLTPPFV